MAKLFCKLALCSLLILSLTLYSCQSQSDSDDFQYPQSPPKPQDVTVYLWGKSLYTFYDDGTYEQKTNDILVQKGHYSGTSSADTSSADTPSANCTILLQEPMQYQVSDDNFNQFKQELQKRLDSAGLDINNQKDWNDEDKKHYDEIYNELSQRYLFKEWLAIDDYSIEIRNGYVTQDDYTPQTPATGYDKGVYPVTYMTRYIFHPNKSYEKLIDSIVCETGTYTGDPQKSTSLSLSNVKELGYTAQSQAIFEQKLAAALCESGLDPNNMSSYIAPPQPSTPTQDNTALVPNPNAWDATQWQQYYDIVDTLSSQYLETAFINVANYQVTITTNMIVNTVTRA